MSTLFVDNLKPNLSSGVHASGHIVQVTDMTKVTDLQIAVNNSSTNTAITQVKTDITPKFANSKIIINFHTQVFGTSGNYLAIMIFRSINGGSFGHTTGKPHAFIGNGDWHDCHISITDSPTYTLGQTISYMPYVYTYNTSATTYFGWGSSAGGSMTTQYLMEVAQ